MPINHVALLYPIRLQRCRLNRLYCCCTCGNVSIATTCMCFPAPYNPCVIIISQLSFLSNNRPTLQHIVDEEAILQLMRNCPMCNRKCRCSKHTRGPYFIVYQSCYFCHYQRKWASQPEARNMNTHKAHTQPKRKLQPKDKVSANAKTRASQHHKTSISESSVSESHDPAET